MVGWVDRGVKGIKKAKILKPFEILVLKISSAPWSLRIFSLANSCQRFLLPTVWLWPFSSALLSFQNLSPSNSTFPHFLFLSYGESSPVSFHLWPRISPSTLERLNELCSKQIPFFCFYFSFYQSTSIYWVSQCAKYNGVYLTFYLGCSSVPLQLSPTCFPSL